MDAGTDESWEGNADFWLSWLAARFGIDDISGNRLLLSAALAGGDASNRVIGTGSWKSKDQDNPEGIATISA